MAPLDEDQVISRLCESLVQRGWTIEQQIDTTQRGVAVIACDPSGLTHYIEAKGATRSRVGSRGYGKPYGSAEVRINVAEAFYTATAVVATGGADIRAGIAFQCDALHRRYVDPLGPALATLKIAVHWVGP